MVLLAAIMAAEPCRLGESGLLLEIGLMNPFAL
jgi:hypothetical protein